MSRRTRLAIWLILAALIAPAPAAAMYGPTALHSGYSAQAFGRAVSVSVGHRMKHIVWRNAVRDTREARRVLRKPHKRAHREKIRDAIRKSDRGRRIIDRLGDHGARLTRFVRRHLRPPSFRTPRRRAALGCGLYGAIAYGLSERSGAGEDQSIWNGIGACAGHIAYGWLTR